MNFFEGVSPATNHSLLVVILITIRIQNGSLTSAGYCE